MPLSYLHDCEAVAVKNQEGIWCFKQEDLDRIRQKYRGYTVSAADPYKERISGCCDRADQY